MSPNSTGEVSTAASAVNLNTAEPTVTRYMELAVEITKALDALSAMVPQFELKHASTASFVNAHIAVPLKFLNTVVAAVEQAGDLQGVNRLNIAEARDTLQFIDAFLPVADRVDAFANGLRFTINSRRAALAADALQIYGVAKVVARDAGGAAVGLHAQNMARDLGKKNRRAAKKQPAPTPAGDVPATPGASPTPM